MSVERVAITELEAEYVLCRTLGHAWDDHPNAKIDLSLYRVSAGVMALRCTRCMTERLDYIGQDMSVAQRYYRYPPRYNTIVGEGTRPNLRGELLRRRLLIRAPKRRARNGAA